MAFKQKTTYEIIDYHPKILITDIPILDIISLSIYYIGTPFYLIYRKITKKEAFNNFFIKRKSEEFKGGEQRYSFSLNQNNELIDVDTSSVLNTKIIYHYDKHAIKLLKFLIEEGIEFNTNLLSDKFFIKERIEYFDSNSSVNTKTEIIFSFPEFAEKIAKFFKIKKNFLSNH